MTGDGRAAEADAAGVRLSVVCLAVIAGGLAYAAPIYAALPSLFYQPELCRWSVGARPGAQAMGYFGQFAWAALGAGAGASLGALASGAAAGRRALLEARGLLSAWALTAVFLVGAWFTWSNWP